MKIESEISAKHVAGAAMRGAFLAPFAWLLWQDFRRCP
jgi:hypothetical protein